MTHDVVWTWSVAGAQSVPGDEPLLAEGVRGHAFNEPNGIWIPVIYAITPGSGDVSRFLDRLPRERAVWFPSVINAQLAAMLARRGFQCHPDAPDLYVRHATRRAGDASETRDPAESAGSGTINALLDMLTTTRATVMGTDPSLHEMHFEKLMSIAAFRLRICLTKGIDPAQDPLQQALVYAMAMLAAHAPGAGERLAAPGGAKE